jgi:peptidoglycan/LPS O-acetylase OafA/YrhL
MMNVKQDTSRNAGAYILIGLGVLFLAGQIFNFSFFGALWPLIVMIPGLVFLYFAFNGDKNAAGLVFPGTIITGTGAILFYQNITNHWESWAYVWALYPAFVGLGLIFMGRRTGDRNQEKTGREMVRWSTIAFAGFWALFELIIFGGDRIFGNILLPVVLIGAGLLMLFRRGDRLSAKRKSDDYVEIKPKRTNGTHSYSEELQAKIDAALAEPDDEPAPTKPSDPSLN